MMNTAFEKRVIVVSLCLVLSLALSFFVILYPTPTYSWSSPGLHNGLGYKPHPQNSGFNRRAVSENQFPPEPDRALRGDLAGEKEFLLRGFPALIPVLSFGLTLGLQIILRTGTVHRRTRTRTELGVV